MKKIEINTSFNKLLSDVFTPVGIYLRLRDRFRDTILLESSDYHSPYNSFSYIGINAIAGIEVRNVNEIEIKYPNQKPQKKAIEENTKIQDELSDFLQAFEIKEPAAAPVKIVQGLFGYTSYDAHPLFRNTSLKADLTVHPDTIPLMRYRLYQYVIAIDHFKSELYICENKIAGIQGDVSLIESIIRSKDIPEYPFSAVVEDVFATDSDAFKEILENGIKGCKSARLKKLFLSREYSQSFSGDEFNVYRALRNINPGPYLFYFDYGDYRLFGSGAAISYGKGKNAVPPHHLNSFHLLADSFPAESMCGLPKEKAIALINKLETNARGYYGGNVGFVGFDGVINQAIMIRTFLSNHGQLNYRVGTELSISSIPDNHLEKVEYKSNALCQALREAELNSPL